MPFKVSDNKLLKKYNKIWERVGNLLNINLIVTLFMVMQICNIKTKIKMYGDRVNTNF